MSRCVSRWCIATTESEHASAGPAQAMIHTPREHSKGFKVGELRSKWIIRKPACVEKTKGEASSTKLLALDCAERFELALRERPVPSLHAHTGRRGWQHTVVS